MNKWMILFNWHDVNLTHHVEQTISKMLPRLRLNITVGVKAPPAVVSVYSKPPGYSWGLGTRTYSEECESVNTYNPL